MRKNYQIIVERANDGGFGPSIIEETESMLIAMQIASEHMNSFDTVKCQIRVNHTLGKDVVYQTVDLTPMLRNKNS